MEVQTTCPQCRHPGRKYYYNQEKQIGYCFHCSYAGGAQVAPSASYAPPAPSVLNAAYVRRSQAHLIDHRPALHYLLNERALKLEAVHHFKLGYDPDRGAIVIPHMDPDGKVVGIKYRYLDPDASPKYIYASGSRSCIYNLPILISTPYPWCVLTEGELDCVSIFQLAANLPVVAIPGMNTFKDRWLKWFERFERIYIAFDNEDAADERAEQLAVKLKDYRCYRLKLPPGIKDVNQLVTTATHAKVLPIWKQLLKEAQCIGQPLIKETAEYIPAVIDNYTGVGQASTSTGYPALDEAMGGLRPGRVYLLKGESKLGKTTFCLHILLNVAQAGGKVLLGSFEMKVAEEMIYKVASKMMGFDLAQRGRVLTPANLERVMQGISATLPVSWINRHDRIRMTELYDAVKIKYQEGYRYLLLDHAQFMMNLGREDAVYSETAKLSRYFKRLTNDFPHLTILLITELNSQDGTFGGKSLEYDSDVLLKYYGTGLEVERSRIDSQCNGRKVQIRWDAERCRYTVF